jgi:3D-(3,5/4)-trihydroxycyclohexane-1,2-dione acylhydrolase (decyclizing)
VSTVRLTTAQAVVRFLAAQHSERDGERRRAVPGICGIFGHGNVCGLGEALATGDGALPFLQPKNEQSMVHTALGYAKATRRLATLACTASVGPGATNLVTGAATATTNRLPVLLLPGDVFANRRPGTVLQQLQHASSADWTVNECLRPVSRFFDRIMRPEQLLTALPEAIRVLLDPAETGAVTLALPQDVQGEAFDFPAELFRERVWEVPRRPADPGELATAAALLRAAERPLIVAGGGVWHAAAEAALAALADGCGVPVAETSAGKGAYRGGLALGGIGVNGTAAANAMAERADVVLCVGTRLSDFTTASRTLFQHPDVRFVGLNVGAADARQLGAAPLVGDARAVLVALHAGVRGWSTRAAYRDEARVHAEAWDAVVAQDLAPRPDERMRQSQVYRALEADARSGDWVVAAAGSAPGDLLKLWRCPPGSFVHLEFAFSCMGHELPAALGIRMAGAEGEVFAVIGDGTYLMAPSELVTAAQAGLKIVTILLANGGYRSIEGLQLATVGRSFGQEFDVDVDYAANAASFGAATWSVSTLGELEGALAAARAQPRPAVIVCTVEPRRPAVASGAWWDLGVAAVSSDPHAAELAAAHARGSARWRHLG